MGQSPEVEGTESLEHLSSTLDTSRGSAQLKSSEFHYIPITPLKKQSVLLLEEPCKVRGTRSSTSCTP